MQIPVSAGILAGGKSTRMGENKAYLEIKDESFLYHTIRICSCCDDIWISVDDPAKYPALPYPMATDEIQGYGPVEGIYQLLGHVKHPYCLILATDMPLLAGELLEALVNRLTGDEECLILRADGRLHPLCGIYRKTVLPVLEQMREQKVHKIRSLFDRVKTTYIDLEEMGFSVDMVENVNTQQEYETLKERNKVSQ
ncbi:molybdenum cofactor guanylyltransferase [Ruminococcus sp. OA3]|uniref:molybdenum cofactor guanylyltransferase n=1 Tax=Ruminococcus sp. OA3 TaxID=2914164 RepID=UPI001F062A8B|nr:molybdenum cofactor guanylyltransferase [Ruminococcus sp. OA3]MCH1983652.1 molybdenum cofactor guanylyltransferase [Ruminococcus sp. OA3]